MKTIRTIKQMQTIADRIRQMSMSIGVVPTMGALHKAHLSLIDRAREENDVVIVTIFVNPKQFGPKEDYLRYPRPFKKDVALCRNAKVDYVFAPSVEEMYSDNYLTYVEVEKLSEILCGKFRPKHFRGVATVVAKLFNITKPHRAYLGEKDYQQLKIIQKMTEDLNFPVEIIPCKTVRDENGLATSSRNVYLTTGERQEATKIYQTLKEAQEAISAHKIKTVEAAINYIKRKIQTIKNAKIDYIKICDSKTLREQKGKIRPGRILVAVWVGKARLIDNLQIKTDAIKML